MTLVDTSVGFDHFRCRSDRLSTVLENGGVLCHHCVVGEPACGNLARRAMILGLLKALPMAPAADHDEVVAFVERQRLMGRGIGWVDARVLASVGLAGTVHWTMDWRVAGIAGRLGLLAVP